MMSYKFSEAAILTRSHKRKVTRSSSRTKATHSLVSIDSAGTVAADRACAVPRTQLTRAPFWEETRPLSQRDLLTIGMLSTRWSAVDPIDPADTADSSCNSPCRLSRRVNPKRWPKIPKHTYTPKQGHGIGGIAQPSDHDSVHSGAATAVGTQKMPLQTDLLTSLMTDSSDQKLPNQTDLNQAHDDHSESNKQHAAHTHTAHTQRGQRDQHDQRVDPDATWADLQADAGHLLEWEDVQDWEEVDANDASIDDDQILDLDAEALVELERSLNHLTGHTTQQKTVQNVIPQDQIHTEHLTDAAHAANMDKMDEGGEFRYTGFVDHVEHVGTDADHTEHAKHINVDYTTTINEEKSTSEGAESAESLETIRVIKVEPNAQASDVQTHDIQQNVQPAVQSEAVQSETVQTKAVQAKAAQTKEALKDVDSAELSRETSEADAQVDAQADAPVAALKTTDVAETGALHEDYTEVHFYVGQVDADTVTNTMSSLAHLPIEIPTERTVACRSRVVLGRGEACFLRAKSGLWSWRVHKLPTLNLHADGPPGVGRNIVMEHRFGIVTVLQGCRVAQVSDHPRTWTMTIVSVEEQALRLKEQYTLRWLDDGSVVFEIQSQWQIAVQSLRLVALVLGNLQKKVLKGYIKILRDLVAD